MAKQYIIAPGIYINDNDSKDYIAPGVYINDSSPASAGAENNYVITARRRRGR